MPDEVIRIIAGPTAAGKSAIALALAERHGALIVSADSRQVYRGFDIGTAKPSSAERARAPHVGIDLAAPHERYSAARWAAEAARWLVEASAAGRPALVVGGTGLWLRALVQPLASEAPMDADRRRALQAALVELSTPELRRWVHELDPARAGPRQGRTQLLRAAEVALLTGTRLGDRLAEAARQQTRRAARWLIVDPGPELHESIANRIDAMLAAGWVDEVRALMGDVPPDAPAWNACGYREIRDVVEGRRTLDEARHAILVSTRQYAKRQRTWFRHQLGADDEVTRMDPRAVDAADIAEQWFTGRARA
ncbi:MAG TPA: tRNA (adenosine(37)-N6)-dimethylallyltransferase MiaA [Gemmatimonadaceae bacterium]|nr:tRNA (adenosine(37)-N6)-dimethylallyltransferase MiaA [Gemmatimonadaceae bacterium]